MLGAPRTASPEYLIICLKLLHVSADRFDPPRCVSSESSTFRRRSSSRARGGRRRSASPDIQPPADPVLWELGDGTETAAMYSGRTMVAGRTAGLAPRTHAKVSG